MKREKTSFSSKLTLFWVVATACVGGSACAPRVLEAPSDTTVVPVSGDSKNRASLANRSENLVSVERLTKTLERELLGRQLSLERHAAWQVMHGFLPYGADLEVVSAGKPVNLLEHLLAGGAMQGWDIYPGDVVPQTGRKGVIARLSESDYYGQGHIDQWLAIFAQTNVPKEAEIKVGTQTFTIEDWLRQSQWDVSRNTTAEYAWTLIALTHYFPNEPTWIARDGQKWSWEDLVEFELKEDLVTAACGGTHRLEALSMALQTHLQHGGKLEGIWLETRNRLDSEIDKVRRWQNRDGSLSSHFFNRPGATSDLVQRLSSSGHLFEFVAIAAPDEILREPWMQRAAQRVCELLDLTTEHELECGSLYHALNGLKVYRDRLAAQRPSNDPA